MDQHNVSYVGFVFKAKKLNFNYPYWCALSHFDYTLFICCKNNEISYQINKGKDNLVT